MRPFVQFTVLTCLAGPAFASTDAICRNTDLYLHGSVVEVIPSAQYVISRDCRQDPLQPRFPTPAVRLSTTDVYRPGNQPAGSAPKTILFDLNSSSLTRTADALLKEVPAGSAVSIIGYACELGDAGHNLELSQRRAEAVAAHLRGRGVLVRSVEGKGECCPVSDQLELNRRAEIRPITKEE